MREPPFERISGRSTVADTDLETSSLRDSTTNYSPRTWSRYEMETDRPKNDDPYFANVPEVRPSRSRPGEMEC